MNDIAIRVEGLGKQFEIGEGGAYRYETIQGAIKNVALAPLRMLRKRKEPASIWALRNVSFEVKPGEVVGIIGRNGAGKSTLLKILSRITAPSEGRATIHGRVGSLLEVGTGFHPELSGRENMFLNGAILGMKRAETLRKFDEIVAFAEVEKFIDTPVKHYSSGMYLRLAFAVAAHLEPEILIVDEVLAVGDAAFQKKCLGKMGEVARGGRTVLFVSHHMPSIVRLCPRAILLEKGGVVCDADVHEVTSRYLQSDSGSTAERSWIDEASAPGDDTARLLSVRVVSAREVTAVVDIRDPVAIEVDFVNYRDQACLFPALTFMDEAGAVVFVGADFNNAGGLHEPLAPGRYSARCVVPGNLLAEGTIRVVTEISTRHPAYKIHAIEFDSVAFQVVDKGEPGSVRGTWGRPIPGAVRPQLAWALTRAATNTQAKPGAGHDAA